MLCSKCGVNEAQPNNSWCRECRAAYNANYQKTEKGKQKVAEAYARYYQRRRDKTLTLNRMEVEYAEAKLEKKVTQA
jgi:ribosomal protein L44E